MINNALQTAPYLVWMDKIQLLVSFCSATTKLLSLGSQENWITSQIAGALWEWPAVCGRHTGPLSLDKSKHWWKVLYNKFKEIVANMALSATAVVKMPLPKNFFVKPLLHPFQQETSILTSYTIGC
jgi:hypothetical protein